jgi:hypothetical protein
MDGEVDVVRVKCKTVGKMMWYTFYYNIAIVGRQGN